MFAGESGLEREVSWAHVCELPDPTEYLASGELLMTVGYTVPETPLAQKAYVEKLADAGLSGLLVAEKMYAPELSEELRSAADRCSLPVLLTAYDVPFTAISRAVAEANRSVEHERLLQAVRVYETARVAVGGASGSELLARLGAVARCGLFLLDPIRGRSLVPDGPTVPAGIADLLTEEMAHRSQPMPAVLRLRSQACRGKVCPAVALFVPASRPAALVAVSATAEPPDISVLRHIAMVAALEVEKRVADYERRRRLGAELLAGLVDGRIDADSATPLLSEWELDEEPRLLASCVAEGEAGKNSDLHLRLEDLGFPYLLLRRAPLLTALLPATEVAVASFVEEIGSDPVGLSAPLGATLRVPDAYREARWALEGARAAGKRIVRYGDEDLPPFLPRSLSESQRVVQQVIGPLLDYDTTHNSQLAASLWAFLSHDRSWKKASAELHVHKQTLVYRIRRVEELTGRSLARTEDVAALWFALRAALASGELGLDPFSGT
jgi:purine catabolism regulator